MKIKNEKQIFDLFVSKDEMRSRLSKPFIQKHDGRVWASDGRIIIMIKIGCLSGKGIYENTTLGEHLQVRDYNCRFTLSVSDLQKAIDELPQVDEVLVTYNEIQCPECKGSGEVEIVYHANCDDGYYTTSGYCPICDGLGKIKEKISTPTGKKVPKEKGAIKLGEGYFLWTNIQTIFKTCKLLGIDTIHLVKTQEHDMNILELTKDIHIALMPMHPDDEIKEEAITVKVN